MKVKLHCSCRRSIRNTGWWELVWATYDEGRIKKAFYRVSRETFDFILKSIQPDIEKNTVTEIPVSPQCIFVLLSNRTFNSDTNAFSTSYARILCIPFTNCAGGRQFFPPRRRNSREETMRSWKGAGKVSAKALRTYHGLLIIMYAFDSMRLLRDV